MTGFLVVWGILFAVFIVAMLPSWIEDHRRLKQPLPFKADVSGRPLFSQVLPSKAAPPKPPPAPIKRPIDEGIDVDEPIAMHCGNCGRVHDGACHSLRQLEGRLASSIRVTLRREADRIVAEARALTPPQDRPPRAALEAEIPSFTDELIARLDRELAAEEHRQGMRYGRRGHCEDCDRKHHERQVRRLQRRCRHRDVVEQRTLDQPIPERICATCGTTLEVMADGDP